MNSRITDVISRIAAEHDGRLTPDMIVDEARALASPLHSYFAARGCWDAEKAQEKWCLAVARGLIRTVMVEVRTTRVQLDAPAFVRDPSAASRDQGYVSVITLRSDADAAREAIIREFKMASAAMARAKAVAAALNLGNEIEEFRERIEAFIRDTSSGGEEIHAP